MRRHSCSRWSFRAFSGRLTTCFAICLVSTAANAQASRATTDGQQQTIAVVAASANGSLSTKRCSVRKAANGWWLVSPAGEQFFSLGVCQFDQGTSKKEYDAAKPSYAAWRHYDTPDEWASANLLRLSSWRFTTIGGWSDFATLRKSPHQDLWLTPVLHAASTAGLPWWDMWDPKHLERMDRIAKDRILPFRDDPRLIGYYSDNEIGWWNATLWKMTLEHSSSSGQRQRLVRLLRDVYNNDWSALLADFDPENANSWQELDLGGMLWVKGGGNGIRTQRRFLSLVAERYYQLMDDVLDKYDPDAMFLGDRYQSFYYPEVVRASAPHVDIASSNLNASWNDGTFLRCYLDTLHAITKKPVLVSEFYMAAEENRSGNPNADGGFPTVATQAERAEALTNTLRALLRLPYVVGAEWFEFYDEPPHGRYDGEDYNFGLVDINNVPYEEVTAAFASLDLTGLKNAPDSMRSSASQGVPRAPADPFEDLKPMLALKRWDRERGFVMPATQEALGDLYICWNPHATYLGVYVIDVVEPAYYRDGKIPQADRAEWTIRIGDGEPIVVRVGAGMQPIVSNPSLRVESISGIDHDARCIAIMEIPAGQFKNERFEAGDQVTFQSSFVTHGRANEIRWEGSFTLAD